MDRGLWTSDIIRWTLLVTLCSADRSASMNFSSIKELRARSYTLTQYDSINRLIEQDKRRRYRCVRSIGGTAVKSFHSVSVSARYGEKCVFRRCFEKGENVILEVFGIKQHADRLPEY